MISSDTGVTRTLVVEDQSMFSDLLCKVCRSSLPAADVFAVDRAARARFWLQQAGWMLLILDIHLPDDNGFKLADEALSLVPALKIVGISADCSAFTVYQALHSPLHAFLDKSSQCVQDLLRALQVVAAGGKYYSPAVLAMKHWLDSSPDSFTKRLSPQEMMILGYIGQGWSDPSIGRRLGLAPETVQWHRKQLMRRLGLKNRLELLAYANQKGFANLAESTVLEPPKPTLR
ncbi:MAG: response regulator transcription factor [Opitutaceae bacterium]